MEDSARVHAALEALHAGEPLRVAFAAGTETAWTLPQYELVLMTVHWAESHGLAPRGRLAFTVAGAMTARFTDQSGWRSALKMLAIGGLSAGLTYGAGPCSSPARPVPPVTRVSSPV